MINLNYIKWILVFLIFLIVCITFSLLFVEKDQIEKEKSPQINEYLSGESTLSSGVGIAFHFTGKPIDISMMKEAGIKVARTDLLWSEVEKKKGKYKYKQYDELTQGLIESGIKPYYILNYSNRIYEENFSIVTGQGQKAFVNYVDNVTYRYKNKGIIWEIWNEPNNLKYWDTRPNYDDYALLVEKTSKVIRKNDPSGIVVAPALAGLNDNSLKWLEEVLKRGILDNIDAISVHPYRSYLPETVIQDYKQLRELLTKYGKKDLPIITGEWGYPSEVQWDGIKLSQKQQAQYLVRTYLINTYQKIPISIWYDWKNDGDNLSEIEHNFGIRGYDVLQSKESYTALKSMTKLLQGYMFSKRIDVGNPNDFVLEFLNSDGKKIIVFWTTDIDHRIKLLGSGQGNIIFMYGDYLGTFQLSQYSSFDITASPRYLVFN
ncbi:cellulase family glycosylhydrolase [Priestia sp. GS2]|uniref:cellulase family glycosylhydrolase n=1 Tax=Priestia sp. GS2 TaxID=3117403 RepID=UPI002ED787D9